MDRSTSHRLRACLAGVAGVAVVAGVLAPVAAVAAPSPSPVPAPSTSPSGSPSATPAPSPSPTTAPVSARPVLAAPALVGPASPADVPQPVQKDVVLAWAAVPGALGYRVQVSQDGDFSDDVVTLDASSVATRLTLPGWLPYAAYRWRVAAQQVTGHGFWSASGAFTKGWRDRPAAPRTDQGAGEELPVFAWDPVAGASEYEVQVSANELFDRDPTQAQAGFRTASCYTVRTRVTPSTGQARTKNAGAGDCDFSTLGAYQTRYWRVRALDHVVDAAKEVDTTPVAKNGISYQPPAPKHDTLDTGTCPTPAATASPSPSATPTATGSPSLADQPLVCKPANTVQASAWSTTSTVEWVPEPTAESPATYLPLPVRLASPALCAERPAAPGEGRQADCSEFPTLDWEPRAGANAYRVYVALDDAFSNIQQITETSGTEWTPTTAWRDTTASQSYYYAVQACTSVRCGAVSSTPDSLRKRSPRTQLTAPAPGALSGPGDVQLRWLPFSRTQRAALSARVAGTPPTAEAYAYRVQVARAPADGRAPTDADFQDLVEDAKVDGAVCRPGSVPVAATVDPRATQRAVRSCDAGGGYVAADPSLDEVSWVSDTTSYPSGSYVWRVQALDASAHSLPWSAAGSFRRDVTPPTVTASGLRAGVTTPLVLQFSEPVTGLSASSVTVRPTVGIQTVPAADGRSMTVRPARTWVPGQSYAFTVGAGVTDLAGNALVPATVTSTVDRLVDDGSAALAYTGAWGFRTASNAVGGGFRTSVPTARSQTTAVVSVVGSGVLVTGCVGPSGGFLDVWVDGRRTRVDTYRAYSGCGVRLARLAVPAGEHRVQLRGVGLKRAASSGTRVSLDAVTAL